MTKNRSNYVNKIEVLNDALKVSFANNSEDIFPNLWLRDHAKDESNWDERSNQRKTFTAGLNPNIKIKKANISNEGCLLYTSPSPRDVEESRMPSSA